MLLHSSWPEGSSSSSFTPQKSLHQSHTTAFTHLVLPATEIFFLNIFKTKMLQNCTREEDLTLKLLLTPNGDFSSHCTRLPLDAEAKQVAIVALLNTPERCWDNRSSDSVSRLATVRSVLLCKPQPKYFQTASYTPSLPLSLSPLPLPLYLSHTQMARS